MKDEIRNIKLDGKNWKVRFVKKSTCPKGCWGDCTEKNRTMRVRTDLSDTNMLDTFLHEMLHAAAFRMFSEEWVCETATAMAKALVKSGRVSVLKDPDE